MEVEPRYTQKKSSFGINSIIPPVWKDTIIYFYYYVLKERERERDNMNQYINSDYPWEVDKWGTLIFFSIINFWNILFLQWACVTFIINKNDFCK